MFCEILLFFCFTPQVNSYGHGGKIILYDTVLVDKFALSLSLPLFLSLSLDKDAVYRAFVAFSSYTFNTNAAISTACDRIAFQYYKTKIHLQ